MIYHAICQNLLGLLTVRSAEQLQPQQRMTMSEQ